jgi:hypothetical protein
VDSSSSWILTFFTRTRADYQLWLESNRKQKEVHHYAGVRHTKSKNHGRRLQSVFSQVTEGSWEPTDAGSCFAHLGSRICNFDIGLVQWNASVNKRITHVRTYTKRARIIAQLRTTFWRPALFAIASCHRFLHERYSLPTNLLESYNKISNHLLDSDRAIVEMDTSFRSCNTESFWIFRSKKIAFLLFEFSKRWQHSASILQETGKNPVELP